MTKYFYKLIFLLIVIFISSCGGSGSSENGNPNLSFVEKLNQVVDIVPDENNILRIKGDDYKNYDKKILILYTKNIEAFNKKYEYEITGSVEPVDFSDDEVESKKIKEAHEEDYIDVIDDGEHVGLKTAESASDEPQIGDEELFYFGYGRLGYSRKYEELTAVLTDISENLYVYVDKDDLDDFNQEGFSMAIDMFENKIDLFNEIYGFERYMIEGRVSVLITSLVSAMGPNIAGLFSPTDLSDSEKSNKRPLIYIDHSNLVPSSYYHASIYYSAILIHEYQHLMNYYNRVIVKKVLSEKGVIGEGFSHFAEDFIINKTNDNISEVSLKNRGRLSIYFTNSNSTCIFCNFYPYSLSIRGGIYIFLKYLYDQAEVGRFENVEDGNDLIRQLVQSDKNGVENIQQTIFGSEDESVFDELFGDFAVALYVKDKIETVETKHKFNITDFDEDDSLLLGEVDGPDLRPLQSYYFKAKMSATGIAFYDLTDKYRDLDSEIYIHSEEGITLAAKILLINNEEIDE